MTLEKPFNLPKGLGLAYLIYDLAERFLATLKNHTHGELLY